MIPKKLVKVWALSILGLVWVVVIMGLLLSAVVLAKTGHYWLIPVPLVVLAIGMGTAFYALNELA